MINAIFDVGTCDGRV